MIALNTKANTHHDPTRAVYGYVPEPHHGDGPYLRALDAWNKARMVLSYEAVRIARRAVADESRFNAEVVSEFCKADAAATYAGAVLAIERRKADR